jgi:hypothetical protein
VQLGLHQVLDRLEHGEIRPPGAAALLADAVSAMVRARR